jgi:DNA primase
MLAQHGVRNAVATLGTATTPDHLEALFRRADEVVFCFDGDNAGRKAAWKALDVIMPHLRSGRQASFLFLPEGDDPDSLIQKIGREAFEEKIASAMALPDYFLDHFRDSYSLQRLDGRARMIEEARGLIGRMPTGALRDLLGQRLASMTHGSVGGTAPQREAPNRQAPRSSTAPARGDRLSVPARVISLVLQAPTLVREVPGYTRFRALRLDDVELMVDLLEIVDEERPANTGSALEILREHPHFVRLATLITINHQLDHNGMAEKLSAQIRRLDNLLLTQEFNDLQLLAEQGAASDEQLARLIELKRSSIAPPIAREFI